MLLKIKIKKGNEERKKEGEGAHSTPAPAAALAAAAVAANAPTTTVPIAPAVPFPLPPLPPLLLFLLPCCISLLPLVVCPCARLCSFRSFRSFVLIPAIWVRLFGFLSCSLAVIHARSAFGFCSCSFSCRSRLFVLVPPFTCTCSFGFHSRLFMCFVLVRACFVLIWAHLGLFGLICLYQIHT